MSDRIRVLHVILNLNYGGMERILSDLVSGTNPARFESHVLALEYLGKFSEGLEQHATLHLARPMSRWSLVHPQSLIREIRRVAPNVVHTHSGVWYKASLAARRAGVPRLIHTDHGRPLVDPWIDQVLDRRAARRTDAIVAVSDQLGHRLEALFGREAWRVRVIINGVRTDRIRLPADPGARVALAIPHGAPVLGSIGRLEHIKGYDVMVEAFTRLLAGWHGGPAPVLVIAGDGTERRALETLVVERGVARQVRLLGWRDDVHSLYPMFTAFTMSSRSEGTSISLLEAMAAGLCPVVTDVGGNAAVLGLGLAHRLVPSEAPDRLAVAWRDALENQSRRETDGHVARRRVVEAFDIKRTIEAYESLYAGENLPRASR